MLESILQITQWDGSLFSLRLTTSVETPSVFLTRITTHFQRDETLSVAPGRQEAQAGRQPVHYSAGKLIAKGSGSAVIPVFRAMAQTVCNSTGQYPGLALIKSPLACAGRGGRA